MEQACVWPRRNKLIGSFPKPLALSKLARAWTASLVVGLTLHVTARKVPLFQTALRVLRCFEGSVAQRAYATVVGLLNWLGIQGGMLGCDGCAGLFKYGTTSR